MDCVLDPSVQPQTAQIAFPGPVGGPGPVSGSARRICRLFGDDCGVFRKAEGLQTLDESMERPR